MKVYEIANRFTTKLANRYGAAEATAIARELLLDHLNATPAEWPTQQQIALDEQSKLLLESQVERLKEGEPLQYVIQTAWFCNLRFRVGSGVLIPRPETEELVEWVLSYFHLPVEPIHILDIGTGSGCIAIALKKRLPTAEVWALEKSEAALSYASSNAKELDAPLHILHRDLFEENDWESLPFVDILVSNPPYIASHEASSIADHVRLHEPALALFAPAADPLHYYKKLVALFKTKRKEKGQLFCEINPLYAHEVQSLFQLHGLTVEIKKDMQGKNRMIRGWVD